MGRYLDIPEEIIEEIRQVYRNTGSVVAILRYIRAKGLDEMYWDGVLLTVEAFGVDLSFTQWLNYWVDHPEPGEYSLTDEELNARMCPLIEKNRYLWDRPAASDVDPKA